MSKRDYYEILGIKRDASESEIKKAYRRIAKENHPDVNPDDKEAEERFKEAAEAYEHLSDSKKKQTYDQFGHQRQGTQRGPSASDMDEILKQWGFNGRRRPQMKGQNIRLNISLTLEDMFTGIEKKIKYKRQELCGNCNGDGGLEPETCVTCQGDGIVVELRQFGGHIMQTQTTCGECGGTGKRFRKGCEPCKNVGYVSNDAMLDISIPAGSMDGMQMVSEGAGFEIKNGIAGDIIIVLTEKRHDLYTRNNNDLRINIGLTYPQLVLGDKIEVVTIDGGKIRATIAPHSKVGDNLRVPNKGMSILHSDGRGDMILVLQVEIPKEISDEERDLLEKLQKLQNKVAS